MAEKRARRTYGEEQKKQLVELFNHGNNQVPGACEVSDLTYLRVGARWAYICILLELGAREIILYSAGVYKNAELVHRVFSTVKGSLFDIQMFHTDRGSEFNNALIMNSSKAFRSTVP